MGELEFAQSRVTVLLDERKTLAELSYKLCLEIEQLPASEQQTKCSIMASNLHMKLQQP